MTSFSESVLHQSLVQQLLMPLVSAVSSFHVNEHSAIQSTSSYARESMDYMLILRCLPPMIQMLESFKAMFDESVERTLTITSPTTSHVVGAPSTFSSTPFSLPMVPVIRRRVVESAHPIESTSGGKEMQIVVKFPGATGLCINFDVRCHSVSFYK